MPGPCESAYTEPAMASAPNPFEAAPRAFISYARSDGEAFATALRERLEAEHPEITLWQDRTRMRGGVGWWKQITDALDNVQFLVLVITPAAIRSTVARQEWRYARQQGVRVCPVMAAPPDELPIDELPAWMRKAHFYDLDAEWATFTGFLLSAGRADRVPFMAPDLPGSYVVRQTELDALLDGLAVDSEDHAETVVAALHGAGGFGKTTIAAALCHDDRVITAYDDGILWVSLGETPDVRAQLTKLYAALTGDRPAFVDTDEASIHLADRLDQKNCLLVVDDVWDTNHLRPFMRGARQCARLTTTRYLNIAMDVGARQIPVSQMSTDESAHLLTSQVEMQDTYLDRVRHLPGRMGQWPLLLKLAAGQLKSRVARGDSLKGALDFLDRAVEKRGPIAFDKSNPTERHDAITSTVQASLGRFSDDDAQRCAQLAVFPKDQLIPLSAASALWRLDAFDTEDLAQRLDDAALVEFDLKYGGIRMHNVLQSFLASRVIDAPEVHAKLASRWLDPRGDGCDEYAWTWVGWHLLKSQSPGRLTELLFDFDRLLERLRAVDTQVVLKDIDSLDKSAETSMLRSVLLLASHGIGFDADQLATQLCGRLVRGRSERIDRLLKQAESSAPSECLALADTSLTHPGGALTGILKSHTGSIEALAMSGDGRLAVTGSTDRTVRVWDLASGRILRTLAGHREWVQAVALTADNRFVLSGSEDRTVRYWSLDDGAHQAVLRGHTLGVTGIAVAADGDSAYSVSEDGSLRRWNLRTGDSVQLFKGAYHQLRPVVLAPDDRVIFGAGDWTIIVLDERYRSVMRTLEGHEGIVTSLCLASDGNTLYSGAEDGTVRRWLLHSGECTRVMTGHRSSVDAMAFADGGQSLVTGSKDRTLRVWDLETGECTKVLEGHSGFVRCLAVADNGEHVLSGAGDHTLRRWNLRAEQPGRVRKRHDEPVLLLALSPDGGRAVSGTRHGKFMVWRNNKDGAPVADGAIDSGHGDWVRVLQMADDGRTAISGSNDTTLHVWDLADGTRQHTLTGHERAVYGVDIATDGARAVSLSRDHTFRAWNLESGHCERVLVYSGNHRFQRSATTPSALLEEIAPGPVFDTAYQPLSAWSPFACSADAGRVIYGADDCAGLWNTRTGELVEETLGDVRVVACVIDAGGSRALFGTFGGKVIGWTPGGGTQSLLAHAARIIDVTMSADGTRGVSAARDDTICTWDLVSGRREATINGPFGKVDTVMIAPDGAYAYSVYGDTLVAWSLRDARQLASVSFDHQITSLGVTPDGHRAVVGDQAGGVHFLSLG